MVRPLSLQNKKLPGLRGRAAALVENSHFTHFITAIILLNAITLGLETNPDIAQRYGFFLDVVDVFALTIFVVELTFKMFAYRLAFFSRGWNVFDFLVVGIALIPSVGPLAVLRALRILRVLRLVSVVPQMRKVITALLHAVPGMLSILAVLLIIFYVSAVLATKLFGVNPEFDLLFGSIGASMYTLFQIMTLEGWSEEVVRPVMDVYPMAWLFFIPFIIVTSFAVLNLFIGIIVDAIHYTHEEFDVHIGNDDSGMEKEIKAMKKDIAAIRKAIEKK